MGKELFRTLALVLVIMICMTACVLEEEPNLSDPAISFTPGNTLGEETTESVENTTEISTPENSTFEIHYLDVGQADAALVMCDGYTMLIDAGNRADSDLIYSYLKRLGINHLDILLITHGHEDHVGGAAGALNAATVGTAYCSVTNYDSAAFQNFVKYLNKQSKEITVPKHGDVFALGSAVCTVLGPVSESEEPNNTSIVLRIDYGNTSFVFTGDVESDMESEILNAGYDVSCTVLKVAHHGSDTSTSYRWLREYAPEYAVISVGKGNEYGHPTENTLSKLRDAEVKTYRTDMQGTVICQSDGNTVIFSVERNADADTLAAAGAGGNHNGNVEQPTTNGGANETQGADSTNDAITYILNTNTGKFHYPTCSSVKSMSEKNKKEITATRQEMISAGYSPCGRCDP